MCVSADHADFRGTTVYAGRRHHPVHGRIEVFGYQNTAVNLASGPNAMLLHLPATGVTPDNFIDVGRHSDVLTRMVDAVGGGAAAADGMDWMEFPAPQAHVFDHDVYTVVLAEDPMAVYAALERVPPHRRPQVSPELFEFYATAFPAHAIVLCCFDNRDARRAKPLLLWYEPSDPDRIVVPAVDCHTGGVPQLGSPVERDHMVIFGVDEADVAEDWGLGPEHAYCAVMDWPGDMRHRLREFLPDRVAVAAIPALDRPDLLANGDFGIDLADLLADRGPTHLNTLHLITP
ncbi:hypothetical protein [Catellatospora sichuanensis]|uniref:hypothetical protein n=1 Tax=Catellatospora sichuanensis TaxID=1969805 RepID=UPI00118454FF|nr:hypothetical protein [Catellatospora sichuanensis]